MNVAFDDIFLTEDRSVRKGYDDGFRQGEKEGDPEAFHLGYHRGVEIGAELGYYHGFAQRHLSNEELSEKIKAKLQVLLTAIGAFPKTNDEQCDILAQADAVRAQFKKVCSLLKVDGRFPEASKLTF